MVEYWGVSNLLKVPLVRVYVQRVIRFLGAFSASANVSPTGYEAAREYTSLRLISSGLDLLYPTARIGGDFSTYQEGRGIFLQLVNGDGCQSHRPIG